MADSLNPTSPEYINVNSDSKPDSARINKDLLYNKDNVNQNKDFDKISSSDKFKNSPLFTDKKLLLSPKISPLSQRVSASCNETKVLNSPPSTLDHFKSPSPLKEEKIINSPLSGSFSNSQEFRLVNPTSRSASVSSQVDSSIYNSQDFIIPKSVSHSASDNDSDAEILELLSDDEADQTSDNIPVPHDDCVLVDINLDSKDIIGNEEYVNSSVSSAMPMEHTQSENKENVDSIADLTATANDIFDETILELQMIDSEGLLGEKTENDVDAKNITPILPCRSSLQFDTDDVFSGLLGITDMTDNSIG